MNGSVLQNNNRNRAGNFVHQPSGYTTFSPTPLPPDPPVQMDAEMSQLLSQADIGLGRLDGATDVLPNPELFVAMYVRKEAVLSSQIEGTQASLDDLLEFEARPPRRTRGSDVRGVVNYVNAMDHGLRRLRDLPLSLRLIREIHERLLANVRGSERNPGEFRTRQNWIGPPGCNALEATFIPPPVAEMHRALTRFEHFLHDTSPMPILLRCGLVHAQFETIHPFLDGNGRMGRLLITFMLCQREVLRRPLLYLSYFLKQHRSQYYDRLQAVRTDGDWEGWLKFFLRGVTEVAQQATQTARDILALREDHRNLLQRRGSAGSELRLLDHLYDQPVITVNSASQFLHVTYNMANILISRFRRFGFLEERTGGKRNRIFSYEPYLQLIRVPTG